MASAPAEADSPTLVIELGSHSAPVHQLDVASGHVVATIDAAGDSITCLVALPSGDLAFTSFDGSWGLIAQGRVTKRVGAAVVTVRGNAPLDLELSVDARAVRWGAAGAGDGFGFVFDKRRVQSAPKEALRPRPARTLRGCLDVQPASGNRWATSTTTSGCRRGNRRAHLPFRRCRKQPDRPHT